MTALSKKKVIKKKVSKKKTDKQPAKKATPSKKTSNKKTSTVKKKTVTKKKTKTASLNLTPEERWKMVAIAAYHKAEKRGFATGHELEDWTEAENEIDALLNGA